MTSSIATEIVYLHRSGFMHTFVFRIKGAFVCKNWSSGIWNDIADIQAIGRVACSSCLLLETPAGVKQTVLLPSEVQQQHLLPDGGGKDLRLMFVRVLQICPCAAAALALVSTTGIPHPEKNPITNPIPPDSAWREPGPPAGRPLSLTPLSSSDRCCACPQHHSSNNRGRQ